MFQTCHPKGRLFYLVLAVIVAATSTQLSAREEVVAEKAERPTGARAGKVAARSCAARGCSAEWICADERD
jgi:hypothetical protein